MPNLVRSLEAHRPQNDPPPMPWCQMLMHWDVGNLKARLMPWTLSLTLLGSFLRSFCGLYRPAGGNCFHKWMHTVCSSAWVCGACRITSTWAEGPKFPSRSLHCDKTINVIHFTLSVVLWLIGVRQVKYSLLNSCSRAHDTALCRLSTRHTLSSSPRTPPARRRTGTSYAGRKIWPVGNTFKKLENDIKTVLKDSVRSYLRVQSS